MTRTQAAPRPRRTPMPIDPRIRQRRIEVKRDEGRRRLRILLLALGTLAALGGGYGLTRSPLLDVDRVLVEGATNTAAADVLVASGLDRHRQMGDVDSVEIEARIEALPWVAGATVTRDWPRTVRIELLERTPSVAMPAAAGGLALLDASGRVLDRVAEPPPEMVTVTAPVPAGEPGSRVGERERAALDVVEQLPATLAGRLRTVAVAEDGSLELGLDGAPPVRFGPPVQVRPKLVAVLTLLERADLRGATALDVRVPTAPVLTGGAPLT